MNKSQKIIFTIFIIIELVNISLLIIYFCNNEYINVLIQLMAIIIACISLPYVFREN